MFDSKLNWSVHIEKIEKKCKMILNMRCLTGSDWGASIRALGDIYVALIRPVIEYGSVVYRSAAKSRLKKMEVIQNQALRIVAGLSPACAIQVEMGELPLHLRYKQLMMNYWANLKGHNEEKHPTVKGLNPCWESLKAKDECFVWSSNKMAKEMGLQG